MKNLFWCAIARIACIPAVTDWLMRSAKRRPYLHIGDYMHRWWLIPPSKWFPVRVRVHHIKRPDADLVLHSHPLDFRSIILRGGYVNEDAYGDMRWRLPGDTWAGTRETLHRIDDVEEGGAWTLFIFFGNEKSEWGFMAGDPPRMVRWRDYVSPNGRGDVKEANDNHRDVRSVI